MTSVAPEARETVSPEARETVSPAARQTGAMGARQLALPLPVARRYGAAEFLPDASNAEALGFLARPEAWPNRRLALHGPAATGKTHLLRATAAARGWPVMEGPQLRGLPALPEGPGLALDDADCAAEEHALFHLLNWCAEQGRPLLLAGRTPPARWTVALPDLASRLRGMAAVGLAPPTDALLAALLRRHFAARQLRVEPGLQDWLLLRLPRTAAAMDEAAARLDRAALAAGGGVTRRLAAAALAGLLDADDDSMEVAAEACPEAPDLL
jgi:chromosomal replication initiation ATPase DnaA